MILDTTYYIEEFDQHTKEWFYIDDWETLSNATKELREMKRKYDNRTFRMTRIDRIQTIIEE